MEESKIVDYCKIQFCFVVYLFSTFATETFNKSTNFSYEKLENFSVREIEVKIAEKPRKEKPGILGVQWLGRMDSCVPHRVLVRGSMRNRDVY